MSTASKFLILACLYMLLPMGPAALVQMSSNDASGRTGLVKTMTSSFSDLKILCEARPQMCERAAGVAASAGDGVVRVYEWAIPAQETTAASGHGA